MKLTSSLFVDKRGAALGFYLLLDQKANKRDGMGLELKNKIEGHGGALVHSFRVANYVLVDQCTSAGADFISMHTTPTRHVVAQDFVEESINRRELVPYSELTLFIEEDRPIVFCLHESLDKADSNQLRKAIQLRGGDPNGGQSNSQVVVHHAKWKCDKQTRAEFENLIHMGTPQWLISCIEHGQFTLPSPMVPVQGGSLKLERAFRRPRNEFTPRDDRFLVAWIATHFGHSMAGRQGNRAYQDMVKIPEYRKWSSGHTWQSWRERYKKKKSQLDPLIEAYILEHGAADLGDTSDEEEVQANYEEIQTDKSILQTTVKPCLQGSAVAADVMSFYNGAHPAAGKDEKPPASQCQAPKKRKCTPDNPVLSQTHASEQARTDAGILGPCVPESSFRKLIPPSHETAASIKEAARDVIPRSTWYSENEGLLVDPVLLSPWALALIEKQKALTERF
ncbi:hypothetical protein FRC08_015189 [Ceratobasidium sp. 394]|nr:hypothetical protein FRC08_015189 [Ceratobasidium sp. 394]KAG9095811.1 hypothetical protein FS749_009735 [Ceratobasidium sp. UAMH 11750]